MLRMRVLFLGLLALSACDRSVAPDSDTPANLSYRVEPSGNPQTLNGVLLTWDPVTRADLDTYRVYSRSNATGSFSRVATTISPTFHESGTPDYEYYVTAVYTQGGESDRSNSVVVDATGLRLPAPATFKTTSLNGAVHMVWSDNAYLSRPNGFRWYR